MGKEIDKLITYDKIKKHYDKVLPYYSECKMLQYGLIKEQRKKRPYRTANSNRQIQSIIDISHTKSGMSSYHRLLQLLGRHGGIQVNHYTKFLNQFLYKNLDDSDIYDILIKYRKNHSGGGNNLNLKNCDKVTTRTQIYYYIIKSHILDKDKKFKIEKYLDFGCGDCLITHSLGRALGVETKNIKGADLPNWGGYSETTREKLPFDFIELKDGGVLPFNDGEFSLVSAFMVLHHVKNLGKALSELNRIIPIGGYLIMREHDSMNNVDYMLNDIEHALYEIVKRRKNAAQFRKEYYAKYYDWLEWDVILKNYGFQFVYAHYVNDNIYFEMAPTRHFMGVYKKVKSIKT